MSAENQFESAACDLCSSERRKEVYLSPYSKDMAQDISLYTATTDRFSGYGRIVKCLDCGLVYTNPRPAPATLEKSYTAYRDEDYLEESSCRSINAHLCLNTIKHFAPRGRLLEIGSSVGYFLNAARLDFDARGIEPSAWACEIARGKFRLEISNCGFAGFESPAEYFDAVVMLDVIEHASSPKFFVKKAAGMLKRGGLLYLITPDIGGLAAKILGGCWWGLRPSHIHYFSRATMRRLLEECGFEIKLCKSYGRIFSYSYWHGRLKNYPAFVTAPISKTISLLGIGDKPLYIDTRDTMEICAIKTR